MKKFQVLILLAMSFGVCFALSMTYEGVMGNQISKFRKPVYSKLNTGESRYLVTSYDNLVTLELMGNLKNVKVVTITYFFTQDDDQTTAILLKTNSILRHVLGLSSDQTDSWHEDMLNTAFNQLGNRNTITLQRKVNNRSVKYIVWKNTKMALITIQ
jgi:hypothetical protein